VKVGATRTYYDVKLAVAAGADVVVVDGMQGGTAATQEVFIEHVGIPTLAAIPQAVQALQELGLHRHGVQLIVSGGIRTGADVAKAMALGADAVAIGTAALIALGDNSPEYAAEYETIGSAAGYYDDFQDGRDPAGITTQDPALAARLDPVRPAARELPAGADHGGADDRPGLRQVPRAPPRARGPRRADDRGRRDGPRALWRAPTGYRGTLSIQGSTPIGELDHRVGAGMPEVVIVGGGLEGCATAWALAERGVTDVVIVERDTVGSGGTGKSSGVVRCHYGVPSLAAMATRALDVLENAEEILGVDIGFHQTGYVVGVGPQNVDALAASLADQRAVGVETEDIDVSEVAKLWPVADLEPFAAFAWEPRGGYGDAYRTAQAFAAAARRAGAHLRLGTTVTEILVAGDRATGVGLADGTRIDADHVVLAAGPWSVPLLAARGIDLPITVHREQIVLVDPGRDLGPVPVFSDLVSLQYVRPESGGEILFGNSDLAELEPADPDRYSNRAGEAFLDMAVEKVGTRFPGLEDAAIASTYAGCYDVTPDFNPAISGTPVEGLVVAAGFSGHGFKISPSVGRLVADLVVDGTSSVPDIPESDFRLSRFAEGELLRSPHPYVGAGQMR
jgi:glycine/D-amino acid oxidase-like deaminating enzyme